MDASLRELPRGGRDASGLSAGPAGPGDPEELLPGDRDAVEGKPLRRLGRRLLVPGLLALAVLLGLALAADARRLGGALRRFDPGLLAPVLALSLVNYALRFGRWQVYLRAVGARLAWRPSLEVFLVGFVLSVTPGKAGELGKAWLVRELGGGEARRVVAAVLCERLTDLLGMVLLVSVGTVGTPAGLPVAAAGLGLSAAAVLLLSWPAGARRLLALLARLPALRHRIEVLADVHERLRGLLRPALLLPAVGVAALAWGAEGVGFGLVLRAYEPSSSWLAGVFDYCLSTLVGAASMLPGGLLASEGSLTAILGLRGMETAPAAAATLLIRAATLWFAVLLGLLALPPVLRRLRREGR